MQKAYKVMKLPHTQDHFPQVLFIRGKPWTRETVRCDKYWAGKRAEQINKVGLYKARLVSMFVKKGVDAGSTCYAVYTYPIMPRKKEWE